MDILELAKETEYNAKEEAQAIYDYTEMLNKMFKSESEIDEKIKDTIEDTISEIIADELNHERKLRELYTFLTGIEANKE